MNTKWSKPLGVIAFAYSLFYIQTSQEVDPNVLIYCGSIIAYWLIGRVTLIEALKVWKGD